MAITLVDQASINDNAQPLEGTYTAGSGSNRLVVVLSPAVGNNSAATMGTCTFGGVAFAQAGLMNEATGNGNACLYVGYIKEADIPSGAQSVSVSWAGGDYGNDLWIFTLDGVDQTTPVTATNGDGATTEGGLNALSLTGLAAGDFVVALAGDNSTTPPTTPPSGYTSFSTATNTSPSSSSAAAYKILSASGDETPDFSGFSGTRPGQIAVAFTAAASGPTITDVDTDETIVPGQTGVVATGTNLSAGASARWVDANANVLTMTNYSASATAPTFDVPSLATTLAAGVKFGSGDFEIWSA